MLYLVYTIEFPKEWPERWPVDHYSSLFCTIHKSMFSIFLLQHNLKCRRSTFYSIKRRLTANNVLHNIIFIVQKIFKIINICNILPLTYYHCLNKTGIRDIYQIIYMNENILVFIRVLCILLVVFGSLYNLFAAEEYA